MIILLKNIAKFKYLYEIQKRMYHIIRRGEQPFALTEVLFVVSMKEIHIMYFCKQ